MRIIHLGSLEVVVLVSQIWTQGLKKEPLVIIEIVVKSEDTMYDNSLYNLYDKQTNKKKNWAYFWDMEKVIKALFDK